MIGFCFAVPKTVSKTEPKILDVSELLEVSCKPEVTIG